MLSWGFPGGSAVKNLPCDAEDARDSMSSIPRSGRSCQGMAPHSSILTWTEEPGRLPIMGSQGVQCSWNSWVQCCMRAVDQQHVGSTGWDPWDEGVTATVWLNGERRWNSLLWTELAGPQMLGTYDNKCLLSTYWTPKYCAKSLTYTTPLNLPRLYEVGSIVVPHLRWSKHSLEWRTC